MAQFFTETIAISVGTKVQALVTLVDSELINPDHQEHYINGFFSICSDLPPTGNIGLVICYQVAVENYS